jgi:hypothetical protein
MLAESLPRLLLPVERKPGKRGRGRPPAERHQRHFVAALHRRAVARCAGKLREMEFNLPTLPALERLRCVGERGHRSRRDDGRERALRHRQSRVRAHVSQRAEKGDLINELLAARGAGSPVKFIVLVMPEAGRSPSTSRPAKRRTAKATTP